MKHNEQTNTWSETCHIAGTSEKFIREVSDEFLSRYAYEYPNGKVLVSSVEVTISFHRKPTFENNLNKKVMPLLRNGQVDIFQ